MKASLFIFFFVALLYADRIVSFQADSSVAESGKKVKLSVDVDVTKMYELHFQAINDKTSQHLSPTFSAASIGSVTYSVPQGNSDPIKIVLRLIEQGKIIDSKSILLRAPDDYGRYLYFCSIFGQEGLGRHSRYRRCFRPKPNVEYKLIYGDDPGVPIFFDDSHYGFYFRGKTYNIAVLGNTKIHYYNLPLTVMNTYYWSCYSGCCNRTSFGYASSIDCLNYRDTEDLIFATYEKEKKRIKVRFTGGYFPCSCYSTSCCGNFRTNIGYIYLWSM